MVDPIMDSRVDPQTNSFFNLPRELRDMIYTEIFDPEEYKSIAEGGDISPFPIGLLASCKWAYRECIDIYYRHAILRFDGFLSCASDFVTNIMKRPQSVMNIMFDIASCRIPEFRDWITFTLPEYDDGRLEHIEELWADKDLNKFGETDAGTYIERTENMDRALQILTKGVRISLKERDIVDLHPNKCSIRFDIINDKRHQRMWLWED